MQWCQTWDFCACKLLTTIKGWPMSESFRVRIVWSPSTKSMKTVIITPQRSFNRPTQTHHAPRLCCTSTRRTMVSVISTACMLYWRRASTSLCSRCFARSLRGYARFPNSNVSKNDVCAKNYKAFVPQNNVCVSQTKHMTQEDLCLSHQNLCTPQDDSCMWQESTCFSHENICMPQANICMSQENWYTPKEYKCMAQEDICMSQENICIQQKKICMIHEKICMLQEMYAFRRKTCARHKRGKMYVAEECVYVMIMMWCVLEMKNNVFIS